MVDHVFGGSWTEEKLERLREYLNAYQSALKNQLFITWYVDAFAGTGSRAASGQRDTIADPEDIQSDIEVSEYRDGSAKIALSIDRPFDRYLFIEKSKSKVNDLRTAIEQEFPSLKSRCEVRHQEANIALSEWAKQRNWTKERAVVFLDPYGMQVNWETVALLANTKAVDLWYLFSSPARLLRRDGNMDQSWRDRLDAVFGTDDWYEHFYKKRVESDLFGSYEVMDRDATERHVKSYIEGRLGSCFAAVAPSLVLRNSKSSPLFLLCFAAANKKGAPIALRIAKSILKD